MKIRALIFASGFLLSGTLAFTGIRLYEPTNATAEVDKENGIYVFVECDPVKEYQDLGRVKVLVLDEIQYPFVRERLIKKAKKEYPDANGIIYKPSKSIDHADVIKFK